MKITQTTKVEDCFNGSSIYRYSFDAAWSRESLRLLSDIGKLSYYPDFPRPFFRVRNNGGMEVKGVEGEASCLVILPSKQQDESKQRFEAVFDTPNPKWKGVP